MSVSDSSNKKRRCFCDFRELLDSDPQLCLDEIILLLLDPLDSARRYAFLSSLGTGDGQLEMPRVPTLDEFSTELQKISEYGVFDAVEEHQVALKRLCQMVSIPNVLNATYEAFCKEPAPWMTTHERGQQVEPVLISNFIEKRAVVFGKKVRPTLRQAAAPAGAELRNEPGDVFDSLGDEFYGVSNDLTEVLVRIPVSLADSGEFLPYSVAICEYQKDDGRIAARLIPLSERQASFHGWKGPCYTGRLAAWKICPDELEVLADGDVVVQPMDAAYLLEVYGINRASIDTLLEECNGAEFEAAREGLARLKKELAEIDD